MKRTLTVALVPVLLAVAGGAHAKPTIAVLVLRTGEAPAELADNLTEVLVAELASRGTHEIIGKEQIRRALGEGSEQAAAACLEQPACLGRLGTSLGVSAIAAGTIGKRGTDYLFNLNLIDIATARVERRVFKLVAGGLTGLVATLQEAARELFQPRAEPGAIKVTTPSTPGARVYLDDAFIGTTPVRSGSIDAGKHRLRVERDGFFDWGREVDVPPGTTVDLALKLDAMPARRIWPAFVAWIALGGAVVTSATGIFFGVLSQEHPSGTSRAAVLEDLDRKSRQARTATILFSVAGTLALVSGVTFIVFRKDIFNIRERRRDAPVSRAPLGAAPSGHVVLRGLVF